MKQFFEVVVIVNATGEVIERQQFDGEDAEAQADAWLANKREMGVQVGMSYGEVHERDLAKFDRTEQVEKQIEIQGRRDAREFCLLIIDMIAAFNKKNASDSQMQATFSTPQYQGIILALLTGATKTARGLIALVGPSIYPAPFVAEILAKMDAQLAIENPPPPQPPQPPPPEDEESPEGQGDEGANQP